MNSFFSRPAIITNLIAIGFIVYVWISASTIHTVYRYEGTLATDQEEARNLLTEEPHRNRFDFQGAEGETISLVYSFTTNDIDYPDLDFVPVQRPGRWWGVIAAGIIGTLAIFLFSLYITREYRTP